MKSRSCFCHSPRWHIGVFCSILNQTHVANSRNAFGQLFWFFWDNVIESDTIILPSDPPERTRKGPLFGEMAFRGHSGKKMHGNRDIVVALAVRVWVHRDSRLGAQKGSVLEPNTNAQRLPLLSHLLRSTWVIVGHDC